MTLVYADFQSKARSEKIILSTVDSAKRLMGWTLHSGSIYKITIDLVKLVSVYDNANLYTEVLHVASVTASKFYYDKANTTLYLRATDSSHPNSRFISIVQRHFFSNFPVTAPWDLSTGQEVYWEPMLKSISEFVTELDNQEQLGFAIEGKGSLVLYNDHSFWVDNFDKLFFENQKCFIYSWSKDLAITEAKILFRGRVQGKSYTDKEVKLTLSDIINELRSEVSIPTYEDLSLTGVKANELLFKTRVIYGECAGVHGMNIDQVPDTGRAISGTISVTNNSVSIVGSGTAFLARVKPGDTFFILGVEYTVATVTSNTAIDLTDAYAGATGSGITVYFLPVTPDRFVNRTFKFAGHQCRQPTTTITSVQSLARLVVADSTDMNVGDTVYVGTMGAGERFIISSKAGNLLVSSTTLNATPSIGTTLFKPFVQSLKINNRSLFVDRDYTVNASAGTIELRDDAEFNIESSFLGSGVATFSTGTRVVTGSGTSFKSQLAQGNYIRATGQADYYQIMVIDSDTSLQLTDTPSYNASSVAFYFKPVVAFVQDTDVLSATVLGTTSTGATNGAFLETASDIVKDLLTKAGLTTSLNLTSFANSKNLSEHKLAFTIPLTYNSVNSQKYRDVITNINKSVFGSLVQNEDFELEYNILSPDRATTMQQFKEFDVLDFSVESTNDRMAKTLIVSYNRMEYDSTTKAESFQYKQNTSDIANYILKTERSKTVTTVLTTEESARIISGRYAMISEIASNLLKITTKMQAARLQVNDKIMISHEKLYDRLGGGQRKVAAIQQISKTGSGVKFEAEDLSNAFNRVATITVSGASDHGDATEDDKFFNGYITDSYGMINNDPETFGLNLIW